MRILDKYKNEIKELENLGNTIIACKVNNEVRSLNFNADDNDIVELLDTTSKDGHRIYIRGILYIMAKALYETYPEALLTVNYQLTSAMFCELANMEITEEMIVKIKNKMQDIIDRNIEIRKVIMNKKEAEEFYSNQKTLRGIVQIDNKQKESVSLYYCEDYYNYFFGVMPIYFKNIHIFVFDIIRFFMKMAICAL